MTPITELNLEQSTYALFQAWLSGFFDGGSHSIGGNAAAPFPAANLGFAQSSMPQPLTASVPPGGTRPAPVVGITMTFASEAGKTLRRWETVPASVGGQGQRQQVFYKPVRWNFWIRSDTANDSARLACMQASQLLESILANKAATRVLAQNGVTHIRPCSPQPVADATYMLRLLCCKATLRYAVLVDGTAYGNSGPYQSSGTYQ